MAIIQYTSVLYLVRKMNFFSLKIEFYFSNADELFYQYHNYIFLTMPFTQIYSHFIEILGP